MRQFDIIYITFGASYTSFDDQLGSAAQVGEEESRNYECLFGSLRFREFYAF